MFFRCHPFINTERYGAMRFAVFLYIWSVNQLNDIKQVLQQLKPELLQRFHVNTIGIFGSAVRDDFSPVSDVDIIVDFNQPIGIEFIDLADYIEAQLQKKVDLVSRNGIKDKYFKAIEGEIVYV
jgi:uncharacterized protein